MYRTTCHARIGKHMQSVQSASRCNWCNWCNRQAVTVLNPTPPCSTPPTPAQRHTSGRRGTAPHQQCALHHCLGGHDLAPEPAASKQQWVVQQVGGRIGRVTLRVGRALRAQTAKLGMLLAGLGPTGISRARGSLQRAALRVRRWIRPISCCSHTQASAPSRASSVQCIPRSPPVCVRGAQAAGRRRAPSREAVTLPAALGSAASAAAVAQPPRCPCTPPACQCSTEQAVQSRYWVQAQAP